MRNVCCIPILGRRRRIVSPSPDWLNQTCENENEKCDESRCETVDTERAYDERLDKSEIERSDNPDERDCLEYTTQEPVKDDDLKGGEDKDDAVKQDAELGERYAENMRIRARGYNIATRKVLDVAEKRRTARFVLCEISRIREPKEGEYQDAHDAQAFHTV